MKIRIEVDLPIHDLVSIVQVDVKTEDDKLHPGTYIHSTTSFKLTEIKAGGGGWRTIHRNIPISR